MVLLNPFTTASSEVLVAARAVVSTTSPTHQCRRHRCLLQTGARQATIESNVEQVSADDALSENESSEPEQRMKL
eukprot:m.34114 g.34114  ORF g.34114 m.34114 type:complete len:75 (+) comp16933_c1_seq1:197-421(+)